MPCFRCADCGQELARDDSHCPRCGSANRLIDQVFDDAVGIEDSLGLKGRHGVPGEVKPYLRTTEKKEWSPSRQVWEEVTRVFNSEAGTYEETYRSIATGKITFDKTGDIKNQDLHSRRELPHRLPPFEPGM
jgi:hypothetical protein